MRPCTRCGEPWPFMQPHRKVCPKCRWYPPYREREPMKGTVVDHILRERRAAREVPRIYAQPK